MIMPVQRPAISIPNWSMPTEANIRTFIRARPAVAGTISLLLAGLILYIAKQFISSFLSGEKPMTPSGKSAERRRKEAQKAAETELRAELQHPEQILKNLKTNLTATLGLLPEKGALEVRNYVANQELGSQVHKDWKGIQKSIIEFFDEAPSAQPASPQSADRGMTSGEQRIERRFGSRYFNVAPEKKTNILRCASILLPPAGWLNLWQCDRVIQCVLIPGKVKPESGSLKFAQASYAEVFQGHFNSGLTEEDVISLKEALNKLLVDNVASKRTLWQVYHAFTTLDQEEMCKEVCREVVGACAQENIKSLNLGPFSGYLTNEHLTQLSKNSLKYTFLMPLSEERFALFIKELITGQKSDDLKAILNQNFEDPETAFLNTQDSLLKIQNQLVDAFIASMGEDPYPLLEQKLKEGSLDKLKPILRSGLHRWLLKSEGRKITTEVWQALSGDIPEGEGSDAEN